MPWDKPDKDTIAFECDTCSEVVECNIQQVRETAGAVAREKPVSADAVAPTDFLLCLDYLRGLGWKMLKRNGRDWTYHCPKCADSAEAAHRQYRMDERRRDQIKARNAS